jgi:uroporphyrinogen III methyltransferase/synthase
MTATVFLVGAGPGHPGLLTLRAVECLSRADLVLYDRLVPAELLAHAPEQARRVCVEDLPRPHHERYPLIHQEMIAAARQGLCVVRLKGGDPFVFGRGAEEAEALREAGIAYEVVPGVTAALGATACAGIPVTHRRHSSAVAFVTGHEQPGKVGSLIDYAALARFPGTLVFYMAVGRLEGIVAALLENGKAADTPAAVIEKGSTSRQRAVSATLATLVEAVRREKIEAPALVVVGEVVTLRERLLWFESRPLFGKAVLVTRPRHQAGEMARALEELGAVAVTMPAVEIAEATDWAPVDDAIERLATFQWLVFTSRNGVNAFLCRLLSKGRDLRALGGLKLAAIGPSTAEELMDFYLRADVVPPEYNSEGLVEALRDHVRGQRVLLARADRGLELLRDELGKVASVEQVAVYSQRDAAPDTEVVRRLNEGEIEYVTLTSTNVAKGVIAALDERGLALVRQGSTKLVTISPRTSAAVREAGLPVAAEAREYTTAGVIEALVARAAPQT